MTTLTLPLKTILEMSPALEALNKKSLPVKTAYRVGKLIRKCLAEIAEYDGARFTCIKKFGEETDKEKQTWTVKPENLEEFTREMTALLEEVVTLEGCAKIDFASLEKLEIEPD